MRNEDVGETQLPLQVLQQVENLRLDRDVESRYRFVADQQFRFEGKGPGDADPLALSAGKTVRITPQVADIQADDTDEILDPAGPFFGAAHTVNQQRFDDDVEHRHARIERSEGVLEDELHLSAIGEEFRVLQRGNIPWPAVVHEGDGSRIGFQGLEYELACRGLATPRFSDQAKALATPHLETDIVDRNMPGPGARRKPGLAGGEGLRQSLDRKQRFAGVPASLGTAHGGDVRHRYLAQRHQPLPGAQTEARHGRQQTLEIGMAGPTENVIEGAPFHDPTVVHDHDVLGDVGDDTQIVGDHQHRHREFVLEVVHQLEDLRLDGDIERGGRFIGNQQCRAADQRHGDHGALAQAAGQFEGVVVEGGARIRKTGEAQHVDGQFTPLCPRAAAVKMERLADLVTHRVQRRQGGHRLLEDHRYASAANGPHRPAVLLERDDVDRRFATFKGIVKQDAARRDLGCLRQNAHDRLGNHCLAGARFTDQRQGARRPHRQRRSLDSLDGAVSDPEADVEILDLDEGGHDRTSSPSSDVWTNPMAARLARVTGLSVNPRSRATRAASPTTSSNPSREESILMACGPSRRVSSIQPPGDLAMILRLGRVWK